MNIIDSDRALSYGTRSQFFKLENDGVTLARNSLFACREEFANVFSADTKFVGYIDNYNKMSLDKFSEFWRDVEGKLGVKNTIIHSTNIPYVVVLEIDPFWSLNNTRRSFLTLLMRCGAVYYNGDFKMALETYGLTRSIKPAVLHFLAGHTTPTYCPSDLGYGVVFRFTNATDQELDRLLVKIITD